MNLKLSNTGLKWIAIITMLIDHIGAVILPYSVYPNMVILRIIGRIAFPIFAFLIVEGYKHTGNLKKYGIRLLVFAFISEVPYDLAFTGSFYTLERQNVFFTLFLGLVALYLYDRFKNNRLISFVMIYGIGMIALFFNTDYNIFGVLLIVMLYVYNDKRQVALWIGLINLLLIMAYTNFFTSVYYWTQFNQLFAMLSIPFIYMYNGEKGKGPKYLFYVFYPLHLLILGLIRFYLL